MSSPTQTYLLAFGAHPDDIEFACGAVIARETGSGRPVHFAVCSRGESGTNGTPGQRVAEGETAAAALGASLEFLDLGGDAHFEIGVGSILKLAAIIRRLQPQIVLAPSLVGNQHPDHSRLGRMVRDAARLARYGGVTELSDQAPHAIGALYYYAVTPDAEPRDVSPVLIDVSDAAVIDAWTASMEAHASQLKTRNYVELQLARSRLNGSRCGVAHAIQLYPNDPLVFDSVELLNRMARKF